jgi:CO dehydrogenase/acetyl-CoA synthase beta subunit
MSDTDRPAAAMPSEAVLQRLEYPRNVPAAAVDSGVSAVLRAFPGATWRGAPLRAVGGAVVGDAQGVTFTLWGHWPFYGAYFIGADGAARGVWRFPFLTEGPAVARASAIADDIDAADRARNRR